MPRPGTAAERGYGSAHQRRRAALLPSAPGQPCTRCGVVLLATDKLHLDHRDDRSGYAGWAHAHCNMSAGAIKGNQARGLGPPGPLGRPSRKW